MYESSQLECPFWKFRHETTLASIEVQRTRAVPSTSVYQTFEIILKYFYTLQFQYKCLHTMVQMR